MSSTIETDTGNEGRRSTTFITHDNYSRGRRRAPDIRGKLRGTISSMAGYSVITGRGGYRSESRSHSERHPDLVVLDLGLPRLDGPGKSRSGLRRGKAASDHHADGGGWEESESAGGVWSWAQTTTITKPFSPAGNWSRAYERSCVRVEARKAAATVSCLRADLVIDGGPDEGDAGQGTPIELTATEIQLLAALGASAGTDYLTRATAARCRAPAPQEESFEPRKSTHTSRIFDASFEPEPTQSALTLLTVYGLGLQVR